MRVATRRADARIPKHTHIQAVTNPSEVATHGMRNDLEASEEAQREREINAEGLLVKTLSRSNQVGRNIRSS